MPAKSTTPKKVTKTKSATTRKVVKTTPASDVKALRTEVNELRARLDSLTHVLHTEFRTQMRHGTRHIAKRLAQEGLVNND